MRPAALLLVLALPAALHAQGARHSFDPPAAGRQTPIQAFGDSSRLRSDLTLAFGGAMGGISGLLAGGFLGARLEMAGGCRGNEWCGFGGAVLGAAIGTTIMIPAAVHLANEQRGSFGSDLAASAAALGGGLAIALVTQDAEPMLLVPLAQIIGAVAVEKRTSRAREDRANQRLTH